MNELRIINFLDAFITNALSVLIPLLLVSRGADVVEIGFIISMSPVIFVVSRSIFAAISDQVGVRRFFILNGAMNVVSIVIYMVASSPLAFSVGKTFEGVRNGTIWAVNRTAVMIKRGKGSAAEEMSKVQAIRTASAAMGIVAVGVLLQGHSFEVTLLFFMLLGFVLLGASFLVEGRRRVKVKFGKIFGQLDFRSKSDFLKRTSLVLILQSVATTVPLTLIFPLFLNEMGYDYWLIGLVVAAYYLVSAVVAFFLSKKGEVYVFVCMWVGAFLFLFGAAAVPLLHGVWVIPFILLMGIGDGTSMPIWEILIFNSVRSKKDVSSDIALLHTPPNLCSAVGLILGGVLVKSVGYWSVFLLCGVLFALFSYFSTKLLREAMYFE